MVDVPFHLLRPGPDPPPFRLCPDGWSYIADPAGQTFGTAKPQMLKGYGYAKEKCTKKKL